MLEGEDPGLTTPRDYRHAPGAPAKVRARASTEMINANHRTSRENKADISGKLRAVDFRWVGKSVWAYDLRRGQW